MKCPNCSTEMTANSTLSPDHLQRMTTHLCTNCCKRVLRVEANSVIPFEVKMPTRVIVHNPHTKTKRCRVPSSTPVDPTPLESLLGDGQDDGPTLGNGQ